VGSEGLIEGWIQEEVNIPKRIKKTREKK